MKKEFRTGTIIFMVILVFALVFLGATETMWFKVGLGVFICFWAYVWRVFARKNLLIDIAEIYYITERTRNSGTEVTDAIQALVENEDDPIIRALVNMRLRELAKNPYDARIIVSKLRGLKNNADRLSRPNTFAAEYTLYQKEGERITSVRLKELVEQKADPGTVLLALVDRLAVRNYDDEVSLKDLKEILAVEDYLVNVPPLARRNILITAETFSKTASGTSGYDEWRLKSDWEYVMTRLKEKFWPTETSV